MIATVLYWVKVADIDRFRCDVASLLPLPFWQQARVELDVVKSMFMLAESADPALHAHGFDMTYYWALYEMLKNIAKGQPDARNIKDYLEQSIKIYHADAYRMTFTATHDTNSWQGHDAAHCGDAFPAMALLATTLPDIPLIYSGQESGLNKHLSFFEKDSIEWGNFQYAEFFHNCYHLKSNLLLCVKEKTDVI